MSWKTHLDFRLVKPNSLSVGGLKGGVSWRTQLDLRQVKPNSLSVGGLIMVAPEPHWHTQAPFHILVLSEMSYELF